MVVFKAFPRVCFFFFLSLTSQGISKKETYGETLIKWHKFKLTFVNNCSSCNSRCITSTFHFNWLVNLLVNCTHKLWMEQNCFVSTRNCLMCVCSWWQLSNSNVIYTIKQLIWLCIPFEMIVLHLSCLRYDIIPSCVLLRLAMCTIFNVFLLLGSINPFCNNFFFPLMFARKATYGWEMCACYECVRLVHCTTAKINYCAGMNG